VRKAINLFLACLITTGCQPPPIAPSEIPGTYKSQTEQLEATLELRSNGSYRFASNRPQFATVEGRWLFLSQDSEAGNNNVVLDNFPYDFSRDDHRARNSSFYLHLKKIRYWDGSVGQKFCARKTTVDCFIKLND
jgi:hypothetical protein